MGRFAARREGKKLKGAARWWASGGKSDGDDAATDLALFKVDPAQAAAWLGEQDEEQDEYAVWPENWDTVQLFLLLQTQWRVVAGMHGAGFTGLDYAAAQASMQLLGVARRDRQDIFAGLVVMERAALPLLNQRKDKG